MLRYVRQFVDGKAEKFSVLDLATGAADIPQGHCRVGAKKRSANRSSNGRRWERRGASRSAREWMAEEMARRDTARTARFA